MLFGQRLAALDGFACVTRTILSGLCAFRNRSLRAFAHCIVLVATVFAFAACGRIDPKPISFEDRLAMIPVADWPIDAPVKIRWNEFAVPYIEAQTDQDLAFALGVVHLHLRGAHLEMLRRLSQGRVSESVGPLAIELDRALRLIGFGRASKASIAQWPDETRTFMQAFVDGLNFYQDRMSEFPNEYRLLAIEPEPWKLEDLLTIGRLAASDVNWLSYLALLPQRSSATWGQDWPRALQAGGSNTPSDIRAGDGYEKQAAALLTHILSGLSRSGSNSVAVAPKRSKSGSALIANDPHLGLQLPNFWLITGIRSPSYKAVGMMLPGLPFIAFGRSAHMAWGGTNLRAASTDLYDVSELPQEAFEERVETIRVRWWPDQKLNIRTTRYGPVISESKLFHARKGEELALRWVGHVPSDEITSLLRAMRAKTTKDFIAAFSGYGLSTLNMVTASKDGDIAKFFAVKQPIRKYDVPPDLVLTGGNDAHEWLGFEDATTLPQDVNPPEGYVVSANERPTTGANKIGYFFTDDDRVNRLAELVTTPNSVDVETLKALQVDTTSHVSASLAKALAERWQRLRTSRTDRLVQLMASWTGSYETSERAPVAFEVAFRQLVIGVYGNGDAKKIPAAYRQWPYQLKFLFADFDELPEERQKKWLAEAAKTARQGLRRFDNWGDMHRMKVGHVLASVPIFGRRYALGDYPVSGSRETVMKTAHGLVAGRHAVDYGSQARHISDMGDPDANYFALFGGQDGWLGSQNFADQIQLWQDQKYIQMPLSEDKIADYFPVVMSIDAATR
ncbi:MAG: penicillin acylase family protein [Pseudomonadota bacterium]